jgi:hypothetical protein
MGPDRLRLVGDTLPNALKGKPASFLSRLPTMVDGDGVPIPLFLDILEENAAA